MTDNEFTHIDQSEEKKTTKKGKRSNVLLQVINGEFLSKDFIQDNLVFVFYVIFLLVMLVSKGYYDKQLTKDVDKLQKEVNDVMGDFVSAKAQMEEETRRVRLVEELEPLGLKETVNPTKVIRIQKEE